MTRFTCCLALVLALAGCAGSSKIVAPQPAKPIEAERFYSGRWYEIARTPLSVTDGCVAGTTDFVRRADGALIERDICREGTPSGREKVFEGPVIILDPGMNAKIQVRYIVFGFLPVTKTYWMLDRAPDYGWFITADPPFDNVAILTRTANPSRAEIDALTARVRQLGYDPTRLEFPALFPAGG
ncbi:MAG: lipocalin family protein [Proteobacteria bacterium]|nr:lipocalin family protein [Pseudomonadota bacterium]